MSSQPKGVFERESRLDEVLGAYLAALAAGQAPDRQELLARHPDLAAELTAFFADQDAVERWTEPLRPMADSVRIGPGPETEAPAGSFGDYELLAEIGRGGMGVVYKARQKSLARLVALKMIRAGELAAPDDLQRFRNETKIVANLDHPRIVPIYEVGEHDRRLFFTMKLIDGGNLLAALAHFQPNPRAAAQLVADTALALHHAHEQGILHRDLKPSNILLDKDGQPHVTDFGLATWLEADSSLSESGIVVGTPSYMAPEQAVGRYREVGPLADVYGLGAILYALLTGRPPFQGRTTLETLDHVRTLDPVTPSRLAPHVPRALEAICLKCLQKEPRLRYASADALAEDLQRFLAGRPTHARPTNLAARAWLWCQRVDRIRDAGVTMVCINVALLLWSLVGVFSVGLGLLRAEQPSLPFWYLLATATFLYAPSLGIGVKTIQRRLWALWSGSLISLVILVMTGLILLGRFRDMGGLYTERDPGMWFAFTTLGLLLPAVQFLAMILGLLAYYANRQTLAWSQPPSRERRA